MLAYKMERILTSGLPTRNKTGNVGVSKIEFQSLELINGDPFSLLRG